MLSTVVRPTVVAAASPWLGLSVGVDCLDGTTAVGNGNTKTACAIT